MAITDQRARERYEQLRHMLDQSAHHIDWLLPFLDRKARESGDVYGMQLNAQQHAENIRVLINTYDIEDRVEARELAQCSPSSPA